MATILQNVYTLSAHLEDAYAALAAKGATIPEHKSAANLSSAIDSVAGGIEPNDLFVGNMDLVFDGLETIPADAKGSNSYGKFRDWRTIRSVSFPDALSVGQYGCFNMFYGCTNLLSVGLLAATKLSPKCYQSMFSDCTSLTAAPALPATTLIEGCYNGMFSGCTHLTAAPELPATTLADSCYNGMLRGSGLTSAPELPASTLTYGCYQNMFNGCKSLTVPPVLSATALNANCYAYMFMQCTALTQAPTFPTGAILSSGCYNSMFSGCSQLTGEVQIPVDNRNTNILAQTFQNMFANCPNVTKVTLDFSTFQAVPTLQAAAAINVFNNQNDTRLEIRVPLALQDDWKAASNWSTYSARIVGV